MYFVGVNATNADTIDVRHILIQSGGWKAAVKAVLQEERAKQINENLLEGAVMKSHWFAMRFTKSLA
jgi:hypothetical protein